MSTKAELTLQIAALKAQVAAAEAQTEKFYGRLVTSSKRGGNRPEMFGEIEIQGETYKLAAWTKQGKTSGNNYLSIAAEKA